MKVAENRHFVSWSKHIFILKHFTHYNNIHLWNAKKFCKLSNCDLFQGTGIRIADHPLKLEAEEGGGSNKKYVVQKYIEDPVLIDGLKFDLRTYVLIRKLQPLEILFASEGMARWENTKTGIA